MTLSIGRRLICFYCGTRSNLKQNGAVREWKCGSCEAVNYLDKHGQITDPPPPDTPVAPVKYAHAISRASSPPVDNIDLSNDTVFCKTCLKNQYLFTQALASYLPPPSDPRSEIFEAAYPAYKRGLEERYPQVCADCAPRAEAKLRAAGYAAKTDHLRRMMDKTQQTRPHSRAKTGWKEVVLFFIGLMWYASAIIQIIWHVCGLLASWSLEQHTGKDELPSMMTATIQALTFLFPLGALVGCAEMLRRPTLYGLLVSIATVWWNPALVLKVKHPSARITGWSQHLQIQVIATALRIAAWWALSKPYQLGISIQGLRGINTFIISLILVNLVATSTTVKLDRNPRISWTSNSIKLAPSRAASGSQTTHNQSETKAAASSIRQSPFYVAPFPVQKLAPVLIASSSFETTSEPRHRLSTPPSKEDDADAMDWTPSQPSKPIFNLTPARVTRSQTKAVSDGPSPFHGHLPEAPIAPAHRLRNPRRPTFRPASEQQKKNFFASMTKAKPAEEAVDRDTDDMSTTETDLDETPRPNRKTNVTFATPKFFLKEDAVDTGLEAMFDSVFSINDEPREVHEAGAVKVVGHSPTTTPDPTGLASGSDKSSWVIIGAFLFPVVAGLIIMYFSPHR